MILFFLIYKRDKNGVPERKSGTPVDYYIRLVRVSFVVVSMIIG